ILALVASSICSVECGGSYFSIVDVQMASPVGPGSSSESIRSQRPFSTYSKPPARPGSTSTENPESLSMTFTRGIENISLSHQSKGEAKGVTGRGGLHSANPPYEFSPSKPPPESAQRYPQTRAFQLDRLRPSRRRVWPVPATNDDGVPPCRARRRPPRLPGQLAWRGVRRDACVPAARPRTPSRDRRPVPVTGSAD